MSRILFISLFLLNSSVATFAGFDGFDFEDNPKKPVGHGGALIVKKYPKDHFDGVGEQSCLLLGHDKNLDSYAPPSGGVEKTLDVELKNDKPYYSSIMTIQREVLEETGGLVYLTIEKLNHTPLLYSQKFKDLLAVIRDDEISCPELNDSVKKSIADPNRTGPWKEMDMYSAFPMQNIFAVAQVMRTHFEKGGNMNNLPLEILAPRKSNASKTVFVKSRDGQTQGVCAYYMGAIADILPELKVILNQQENIIPQSITNKSLADLKVATKELSINVTSEVHNNSIIPYWNSQFKKTSKEAMLPDGWKVSHRKTVKHPTITQTKEGDLTIEGAFCGIAHTISLAPFFGQTITLSANIISDKPGPYIEFWTSKDIVSSCHKGNNQSEVLSVSYTVVPEDYRIYIGTKSEASFTVKDLKLSQATQKPIISILKNQEEKPKAEIKEEKIQHNNCNKPALPQWNAQFKITLKETQLPDNWHVHHRKDVKLPTITQKKEGDLTIEGAFCGIAHPIDLSRFIGQTVKLSANLISDRPGPYIEFWTTTDIVSPNHRGNNQSEELSVIYTVVPGKNFRIYVGTKSEASFTVKDLNLSIVPQ